MALYKVYTWEYRLETQPYDKIVDVLEAFFASYPGGDYTCERRETYRLQFRRGEWKKAFWGLVDNLVPASLPRAIFSRWPVIVYALVRPGPQKFLITVRYEVHLPRSVPKLIDEVQTTVDQYCRKELDDLAAYLAECTGSAEPPRILNG